jgi:hypothetical protein
VCIKYDQFVIDKATRRLAEFSIDGRPLAGRIVLGNGQKASSLGVSVSLVSGYLTAADQTAVVYDVQNGTNASAAVSDPAYLTAGGRQFDPIATGGASDVQPGATGTAVAYFDVAELGGMLVANGYTNGFSDEWTVKVPVPTP